MSDYIKSIGLLVSLLNPFLIIIYLIDIIKKLEQNQFRWVLIRAGLIAFIVFSCFTILGDTIFSDLIQAKFESFQIFGGIVFLLIGIQFVFRGPGSIEFLRGESGHIAGSIAMPVLIGPGTISASIVIGQKHDPLTACSVMLIGTGICLVIIFLLKKIHDFIHPRREVLIERYIEVAGRITALYIGTISINMIMQGLQVWVKDM